MNKKQIEHLYQQDIRYEKPVYFVSNLETDTKSIDIGFLMRLHSIKREDFVDIKQIITAYPLRYSNIDSIVSKVKHNKNI